MLQALQMASIKTEETSDVEGWYDDNICSLTQQLKEIEIKNEVDLKCLINKATWLKYIESPFLWHTQEKRTMSIERVIERHQLKEIEINVDILDFSLRRYVCGQYSKIKKYSIIIFFNGYPLITMVW